MATGLIGGIMSLIFGSRTRDLSDAKLGDLVEVRGRIVPRDLIESPLTGERGVYYSYSIDEFRASVEGIGNEGFWRSVERDEAIAEFYLQIGDQRVIVSPTNAKVSRASGPNLRNVDYNIINRRAAELVLGPGDEVEVSGILAAADDLYDDARDYRARPERLMLRAKDDGKLQIKLLASAGDKLAS